MPDRPRERSPRPTPTPAPARKPRVAVFGGDGRFRPDRFPDAEVRVFTAQRDGGNGGARRLCEALRRGGVDRVVVLIRWNGHSSTRRVRDTCRRCGVPVELIRG